MLGYHHRSCGRYCPCDDRIGRDFYMMDQFTEWAWAPYSERLRTVKKSGLTENDLSDIAAIDNVQGISPSLM